jgi:hypothetical protein
LLIAVTVGAIEMPGIKKSSKYYNYTQNGVVSLEGMLNIYAGKNGLIAKA